MQIIQDYHRTILYDPNTRLGAYLDSMQDHVQRHPEIGAKTPQEYFALGANIACSGLRVQDGFFNPNSRIFVAIKKGSIPDPEDNNRSLLLIRSVHKRRKW